MTCERLLQATVADRNSRGAGHDNKVSAGQLTSVLAKSFPDQALEPVAVNGTPHLLL